MTETTQPRRAESERTEPTHAELAQAGRSASTVLWTLTTLVVILLLSQRLISSGNGGITFLVVQTVLLTAFAVLHGARRYGWRAVLVFSVATLVISNALENLSVVTGFPFGHYHYTSGPKLFLVPLWIGPTYAAMGYLAWTIATLLIGDVHRRYRGHGRRDAGDRVDCDGRLGPGDGPDELHHQLVLGLGAQRRILRVPLVNFLGWSLTTYLFLQVFALYLRLRGPEPRPMPEPAIGFLVQPLLLHAATAAAFVIDFCVRDRTAVTDALGQTWRTGDIAETSVLSMIYGMGLFTVLAGLSLAQRSDRTAAAGRPPAERQRRVAASSRR